MRNLHMQPLRTSGGWNGGRPRRYSDGGSGNCNPHVDSQCRVADALGHMRTVEVVRAPLSHIDRVERQTS
jgi:hypothetical protein